MGHSLLSGFIIALGFSSLALAHGTTQAESIVITKIVQSGDFMPPAPAVAPTSTITFNALSNGCADSKDFKAEVAHEKTGEFVTIVRTRPDDCKKGTRVEEFQITTTDLAHSTKMWDGKGVESVRNPIFSLNPLAVQDETTH